MNEIQPVSSPRRPPSHYSLVALAGIAGTVAGTSLGGAIDARTADAWNATPTSFQILDFGVQGDRAYNYDFNDTTGGSVYTNVDWPMTLIFDNQANVNRVKDALEFSGSSDPPYHRGGDVKQARLKDAPWDWVWDGDSGIKNQAGTCPTNVHMRVYADPFDRSPSRLPDRNYSDGLGYYVIASTHLDIRENCMGEKFGKSEEAEQFIAFEFEQRKYVVHQDVSYWYNIEDYRTEGAGQRHIWNNNGFATEVVMP